MGKHSKLLFLLLIFLLSAAIFAAVIHSDLYHMKNIERVFSRLGTGAVIIFFLLCAVRTFALLPCGFFSAAAGVLFGPLVGTILTLAGFVVNAWIVYAMSGYFGREWVKKLLKNRVHNIDDYLNTNSFSSFLFLRIIPLLPYDAVSCIAGISKAKVLPYLFATAIGSIPGIAIYAYFGDSLKTFSLVKIGAPGAVILVLSIAPFVYKLGKYGKSLKKHISKDTKSTI